MVGCRVETTTLLSLLLVTMDMVVVVVVVSLLVASFTLRPPTIVEGRGSVKDWKEYPHVIISSLRISYSGSFRGELLEKNLEFAENRDSVANDSVKLCY